MAGRRTEHRAVRRAGEFHAAAGHAARDLFDVP
jgi:hypothetical protein